MSCSIYISQLSVTITKCLRQTYEEERLLWLIVCDRVAVFFWACVNTSYQEHMGE